MIWFQGVSEHFTATVCVKIACQECQSFLKYVLLVMEDTVENIPLIWQHRFELKATFCHTFASWWSLSVYPPLFSVLFSFLFFHVLFCSGWLADRGWSVTQPSLPSRTLWSSSSQFVSVDMTGLPRGGLVSLHNETLHSDPHVNSFCGSRVGEGSGTGC